MPGIAGIVYPDIFQVNHTLDLMLQSLSHRGEHSWETFTYKNIQFGCRGTSIYKDEINRIAILLDGHIYNVQELIQSLKEEGLSTIYRSTEELLVQAYLIWGQEFLSKIDGTFAIALLDERKELVMLARDRIGVQPLYWYCEQGHFLFASELKSLLSSSLIPQTPAFDAIAAYFSLGYFPQDITPISNVSKLLPSHYLLYSQQHGLHILPYWSYSSSFLKKRDQSISSEVNQLDELFRNSLKQRISNVKNPGCFVLGGLGSATIASYLCQEVPKETVKAYTTGFQEQNESDVKSAEAVAEFLNIPYATQWITPDTFLKDFVNILWHLDEPLADQNVIATWTLASMASSETKVVFSGMGSDELLAGHNRYSLAERKKSFISQVKDTIHPILRNLFFPILNFINRNSAYYLLREIRSNPWQSEFIEGNLLFSKEGLANAFPPLKNLFDTDILLQKFHHISRIPSLVSSFMYLDVKTKLPDCYLLQYERLMTSQGLDWRTPFLDQKIIEYAATIPEPQFLKEAETASILKQVAQKTYPSKIFHSSKKTRKHFLSSWLEVTELKTIFPLLSKGTLVESGLLSESWLRIQTASPKAMQKSFDQLWAILVLEVWFRLFVNFPVSPHPPSIPLIEFLKETQG